MSLQTSFGWAWPVFAQGLFLGLGLIVAIGAQNAFVLRQGLRREHVGAVGPVGAPRGERALRSLKLMEIKNLTFISNENIFCDCSALPA
jgi:hypothetical protein